MEIRQIIIKNSIFLNFQTCFSGPGGSSPIGNPFAQPGVIEKLEANPQTREYLKDPAFRQYLQLLQHNASAMQ